MGHGNIFLVGMMGSGKTTLGRALAQRMHRPFADTDRLLVDRTGVPVTTIFEIEGEEGFRKRESTVIAELAQGDDQVIATGGGAVLAPENRAAMRSGGTVIYLRARLEHLWERTRHDSSRPLLKTADPRGTLEQLLLVRDCLYREAAHIVVDTGTQSASTLVARVVAALRRHEEQRG